MDCKFTRQKCNRDENTVKLPLSKPLINWCLLLLDIVFGHTNLISCSWSALRAGLGCVTCVNSVFSMQPWCVHSLHPVASPPSAWLLQGCLVCGVGTPFFFLHLGYLVVLIICRTISRKLNLSGLTILRTYVGYMTIYNIHVSQLQAFLSYGHPPPRSLLPR